ncbi:hypothetical protein UFOVP141_37 [uncultured Caudovirales phage]|uniref:Uncharacterized protein n=1 Tax=uncultured Caudovirales phage TaxID=2100421 RepID=A0A6J7VT57_9CAUD|nr:hypothetical protein UFOVP141_37 [uncultured Caudovirales phage]
MNSHIDRRSEQNLPADERRQITPGVTEDDRDIAIGVWCSAIGAVAIALIATACFIFFHH